MQRFRPQSGGSRGATSGSRAQTGRPQFGSRQPSRFGRGGGRGRGARPLDPNLFIKKATSLEVQATVAPSTARFADYAVADIIKRNIAQHGYTIPTAIQEQAIPYILEGRDIIGVANTGSGKTATFLISFIDKALQDRSERVLIVVPTRELAQQIGDEFRIFARGTGIQEVTTVGGTNIRFQMQSLRNRPNFVIGTPGRLKDLISRGHLHLSEFKNVVLDEVDRMVDIGFIEDIKYLVSLMPTARQSLFFSATFDSRTREILRDFVKDPVTVSVKQQDTAQNIDQDIVRLTGGKIKIDTLHDLLIQPGFEKVIIFVATKRGVERVANGLYDRGIHAATIHGDKSQAQRQRALKEFKFNRIQVLIATDVAARGIDIDNVSHVINYDAPTSFEDYTHRIGRTGRAGRRGVALTFVD